MRLRAAVLTALAGAALAVPAAPAAAAACTRDGGVTVVVDFASLGGGEQTRCAGGDPSSGLAALRGAGFTPTRAAQEPGYFVCRIDGKPANDPCQRASPADAYWSYWHAKPGGTWTYSDLGAADYDPAPGAVEGWAFGAGKPPSSSPPQPQPAARPTTAPTPTASPARRLVRAPSQSAVPVASAATALPTPTRAPSAAPASAAVTEPSTAAPEPAASVDGGVHSRVGYALDDGGPGTGVIVAGSLLLVLLGAGALQLRTRRRQDRG